MRYIRSREKNNFHIKAFPSCYILYAYIFSAIVDLKLSYIGYIPAEKLSV